MKNVLIQISIDLLLLIVFITLIIFLLGPMDADARPSEMIFVPVQIQGKPVECLLDTGSSLNAVSTALVKELNLAPSLNRAKTSITVSGRVRMPLVVVDNIHYRGKNTGPVDVSMINFPPNTLQCIIGMDFFVKTNTRAWFVKDGILVIDESK